MAEPARQTNPDYDADSEKPLARSDLRVVNGGGEGDGVPRGKLQAAEESNNTDTNDQAKQKTPDELRNDEESANSFSYRDDEDDDDDAETLAPTGNRKKKGRFALTRRKSIISVAIALTIGGGFFGASISTGPMQLIHLAEILKTNLAGEEDATASRTRGLFRAYRSGDAGETRVGRVGSKVFSKTISQLKDVGIEFDRGSVGQLKTATLDTAKLKKVYPELDGMSKAEAQSFLAEKFGLNIKQLGPLGNTTGQGHKFAVNGRDFGIRSTRALLSNSLSTLEDGKVIKAIKMRSLAAFFNDPSLWSPGAAAAASKENKIVTKAERKAAEEERNAAREPPESAKAKAAKADVKGKLSGWQTKAVGAALLTTSGMCLIRGIADGVIIINRASIVVPAAAQAADKISYGSKVQLGNKYGSKVSADEVGGVVESFRGADGSDIWDAQALKATSYPYNSTGTDIGTEFAQAFSKDTQAHKIKKTLGGGTIGAIACSKVGIAAQIAASVGLLFAGLPSGGASWGVFAAKTTGNALASTAVIYFVQKEFVNLLKSDAVFPKMMAGAVGGNLLAFGARELANTGARQSGGVELSDQESVALDQKVYLASQAEFRHKSKLAQLFDLSDYRSAASRVADRISPNPSTNIAKISGGIFNLAGMFGSLLSPFSPKAHAASKPYHWGFNRFGIPSDMLTDPAYENPYENADKVAAVLDTDTGQKYVGKAEKCFGVSISKGADGWQAVPKSGLQPDDINPNGEEYLSANCNDLSDSNWKRVMLFVFDSRTMDAIDCYQGETDTSSQSCENSGSQSTSSTSSTSTSGVAGANIDMANIREPSDNIDCAPGTKDLGVQDGYTEGRKVAIRICAVPNITSSGQESHDQFGVEGAEGKAVVNSRVSGAFYALAQAAKKDGVDVSALSSFRSMANQIQLCNGDSGGCSRGNYKYVAKPGTSNHQLGVAIDFSHGGKGGKHVNCITIGGKCTLKGEKTWEWLTANASKFGIKQYVNEFWHWSPLEN